MAAEFSDEKPPAGGATMAMAPSSRPASSHSHSHGGDSAPSPPPEKVAAALHKADSQVVPAQSPAEKQAALYNHLPQAEADMLRAQVETADVRLGWLALYRFSTRNDLLLVALGVITSIVAGAAMPLMTIIFGTLAGTFQDFFLGRLSYDDFMREMTHMVLYFVYLAIGMFVATYISTVTFIWTGEHISARIRELYLESCLRQNIGFFDKLGAGEVTTRITADTNLIQEGISEKVGLTLTAAATFISAFVIGFIMYWRLTLILLSTVFALVTVMGGISSVVVRYNKQSLEAYAQGGSVAEETISSIRNAVAFGTQDRLARQYDVHLARAEVFGFRVKAALACMIAGMMTILNLNYGLAFWMGGRYLVDGSIGLNKVLIITMAVLIGAFSLGNVAPHMQAFTTAVAAAAKIYSTIERRSVLDPYSDEGDTLDVVEGNIRLENIKHIYPSRPEVVVMEDVSLDVPAGKTTALVGASGSGKSTIVGLVERFYNPVRGTIYLDGRDISTLNLRWLRQNIALVSQEPVLFGESIYENIRHGLIGTRHEDADDETQRALIIEAAKKANAHEFVSSLPEGYETNVGERGFLLSGGQKQRIAIARAIVSDPKILLLDEATSALDQRSEGVVQAALEAASAGRTTITIAHRLSTIRDADNIVVMSQGRIVEQGTHNELLDKAGAYAALVSAQEIAKINELTAEEEEAMNAKEELLVRKMSTNKEAAGGARTNASAAGAATAGVATGGGFEPSQDAVDPDDANLAARLDRTATRKSASSLALQGRKVETEDRKYPLWTLIRLIASFNKEEWHLMLGGLFFSIICGGGQPTQSFFFAKLVTALSVPLTPETVPQLERDVSFWCLMFLMLALVLLFSFVAQGVLFARCSERLVHRVRDRAFRSMLRMDIAEFDRDENTSGALTSFLSTETTHVAGLSGATLGTILTMCTTLIAAFALALSIGWKLGLVCIATVPVLLAGGFLRFWMLAHYQRRAKRAYTASASYASEAITAVRTVASLTRERDVQRRYRESLDRQLAASLRSVLRSSLLYAASQSMLFLVFALGFWYGGSLIARGEYSMFSFFVVFMAVTFGAQSAGTIFSFAPDMGKASHATSELKTLFDRRPKIDTWSDDGERLPARGGVEGTIEFRDVHFRYPTRPEQPVLRGLNLTVHPGQYVALVGASGCGKSTTIALLERFYDPLVGGIFVDGKEISSLNVNDYRAQIALVSQEPTLYSGTIKENILLGSPNEVSDDAVEFACREANIYDFILSLPEGFNTVVGSKGTLLSGGQKQRIAIARALIRDPKILLLDEATSALDSTSEKVVQHALDQAAKGRTTIAVAHRLSTIQKADIIYVFDQGRIVEQGTHSELMKRNGRYAELVNLQSLEKNG